MSADVSLEEPARRLTGADGARDSDVWVRSLRPWDGYFAAVWAVTLAVVLGAAQPSWPLRAVAASIVALNLLWYVLVGRPAVLDDTGGQGPARRYVVGAMLLFLPTAFLVNETQLVKT
ncbi:hypothetical protein GCM10027028_42880 [Streptomyces sundarbansensis]